MSFLPKFLRGRRPLVLAGALAGGLCVPMLALAAGGGPELHRLPALETRMDALSRSIGALETGLGTAAPFAPAAIPARAEAPILVAQSFDAASVAVRLDALEQQMRTLTGQVEGLQFQATQLQALLERMQEDLDFRFQQLEGGASSGKTDAVTQSGGAMPSGASPQTQAEMPPAGQVPTAPAAPSGPTDPVSSPATPSAGDPALAERLPPGQAEPLPDPFLPGESRDPLLNGVTGTEGTLGTLTGPPLGSSAGGFDVSPNSSIVTEGDAEAQFQAGYEAAVRGDFAFAEDQFRQFVALFPNHARAPEAINWLGEALIQRGAYDEAADVLLSGYQSYPDSSRAPDILLKLGIAMHGAGETEVACRTFSEVERRYTEVSPAFRQRLLEEQVNSGC